ncbi:hypothetical protein ACSQ67_019534 [Phaseolus vulgaris]
MFGPCRLPFSSAYINYEAWFRNGALKADLLGFVTSICGWILEPLRVEFHSGSCFCWYSKADILSFL